MAKVLAVANQKGGVGKTTTTANLGIALAKHGQRVLCVDMDPQGNLTACLGCTEQVEKTVADCLLDRKVPLPILHSPPFFTNTLEQAVLDVVPANLELAGAEAALMNKLGREFRLRDQLATVDNDYDYVVIDTPPSLGILTINSLVSATSVIIPTEARFFSLQGLQMLEESMREIQYLNPNLKTLGIVLSKYDKRLKEERTVSSYLRKNWHAVVFDTEVGTNSKILEAASAGVPVDTLEGGEKAADIYRSLAKEVIRRG